MSVFGFRFEVDTITNQTSVVMGYTGLSILAGMDLVHLQAKGDRDVLKNVRYKRNRDTGELTLVSRQDSIAAAKLEPDLKSLSEVVSLMLALTLSMRQIKGDYRPW